MKIRYQLLTALVSAVYLQAAPAGSQSPEVDLLADATIFKLGWVGMAPHVSEEEMALAALLQRPDHRAQLATLLRNAKSNEGKLYALCGMRSVSASLYEGGMKSVAWNGEAFNSMQADVIKRIPVKEQLERMRRDGCGIHRS
jgi:hypothetical protein